MTSPPETVASAGVAGFGEGRSSAKVVLHGDPHPHPKIVIFT